MKTTEQEIIDMENFYETATLEEALAYFRNVSRKCVDKVVSVCKSISRILKKQRSCLAPMGCRTVRLLSAEMTIEKWRKYIRDERRYITNLNWIREQIAMEEVLEQAIGLLIKK